ncbi:hypothetical protein NQ025_12430 [Corynebacterium phoceense]|nr:hypothetical protein [Corynebacterium phoceense]MCQ9332344.1 hypothetical protein [Corynebacterium phoceense]
MAIPITLHKKIAVSTSAPIRESITVQQFCKNIGVSKQTNYNIRGRIAERVSGSLDGKYDSGDRKACAAGTAAGVIFL